MLRLLRLSNKISPCTLLKSYSTAYPKHTLITMPALSPTMTHGNIGKWAKKIGDEVVPGDVLVEIETDKATMDFESQDDGYIATILMSEKKDVDVNTPIGVLVENKEDVDAFKSFTVESIKKESEPVVKEATPSAAPKTEVKSEETSNNSPRKFVSPLAKVTAAKANIPVSEIQGSGPSGRVIKADVDAYKPTTATVAQEKKVAPVNVEGGYVDTPLTNVRKVIASRLTDSKVTIPHYYLTSEIRMDKILKLRKSLNSNQTTTKLSLNDFIIKAAGLSLQKVPTVNSSWHETYIRQYNSSDIAVAVATDNGLITPIIKGVEGLGLGVISSKVKEMAGRARIGKLMGHEYQGGTFTISNLGMYNIQHFTAIINPPHAGILAVGSVSEKVVREGEGFKAVEVLNVTLSLDHRVVDGAVGAVWLQKFKGYLEDPLTMLL